MIFSFEKKNLFELFFLLSEYETVFIHFHARENSAFGKREKVQRSLIYFPMCGEGQKKTWFMMNWEIFYDEKWEFYHHGNNQTSLNKTYETI